jgi:glycosyltransferase involved in cell wall biosynthesis
MGNVIVEAWAFGVPIVAAASVGPSWLIRDREDGILAPIEDDAALADGIRAVLSSRETAARLVANGRRRVADEFSENRIVQHYIDVFERVRRKPGRAV